MGSSRFGLKVADEDSKSTPHEFSRSHWLKATGQYVIERVGDNAKVTFLLQLCSSSDRFESHLVGNINAPVICIIPGT